MYSSRVFAVSRAGRSMSNQFRNNSALPVPPIRPKFDVTATAKCNCKVHGGPCLAPSSLIVGARIVVKCHVGDEIDLNEFEHFVQTILTST